MGKKYVFPPGPESVDDINPTKFHLALVDHKQYGSISYFEFKKNHIVSLNTVESIKEALNDDKLKDRVLSFSQKYILSDGIAVQPYSDTWHKIRDVFSLELDKIVQFTENTLEAQTSEFKYLRSALSDAGDKGFDPREIIRKSVTNAFLVGLVGQRSDYNHPIFDHLQNFEDDGLSIYGNPKANYILMKMPFLRHFPAGYGKYYRGIKKSMERMTNFFVTDIKKQDDDNDKDGMIYSLLEKQKGDDSISDHQIMALVQDIVIGGILTTKAAVSTMLYQLIHRPEIITNIQTEIDQNVGQRDVTLADLDSMSYCQAVVYESLRQCPLLPGAVVRSSLNEDVTMGEFTLPPGSVFIPNLFGVNHDKDIWPDPWNFDPSRFVDDNGKLVGPEHQNRQNLINFGDGMRGCPGQKFAWSRILLYLINLLQYHDICSDVPRDASKDDPKEYPRNVILQAPPYNIIVRARLTQADGITNTSDSASQAVSSDISQVLPVINENNTVDITTPDIAENTPSSKKTEDGIDDTNAALSDDNIVPQSEGKIITNGSANSEDNYRTDDAVNTDTSLSDANIVSQNNDDSPSNIDANPNDKSKADDVINEENALSESTTVSHGDAESLPNDDALSDDECKADDAVNHNQGSYKGNTVSQNGTEVISNSSVIPEVTPSADGCVDTENTTDL